ncbi:MAG: hypothetical protein JW902_19580 [Syntrophaceae bacterium]|nr:hypothetical protein [Syntrophaceae bacterium]
MNFKRNPFQFKGDFPADDVDNGLADIAERSDVIEIDTDFNGHRFLTVVGGSR